eukprot:TRINITY_DN6054_c1_g1_i1.p1 TRINITY_DN6054_c1_g1~~TRINITY_DN6054_c1_g1_i1.p1  ORF type:complete len:215 (-),score=46.35 TRINITY_DN6054_c1_g1_i1:79-723(-)
MQYILLFLVGLTFLSTSFAQTALCASPCGSDDNYHFWNFTGATWEYPDNTKTKGLVIHSYSIKDATYVGGNTNSRVDWKIVVTDTCLVPVGLKSSFKIGTPTTVEVHWTILNKVVSGLNWVFQYSDGSFVTIGFVNRVGTSIPVDQAIKRYPSKADMKPTLWGHISYDLVMPGNIQGSSSTLTATDCGDDSHADSSASTATPFWMKSFSFLPFY